MAFDPSAPYEATRSSGASRAFDPSAPFQRYTPPSEEEVKDAHPTLRAIADVPLSFAKGAATSIRNISDAFGANNDFSKNVRGIEDLLGDYMSAQYHRDAKAQQEILARAKDQGVLANLEASWEYLKVAPIDTITNLAGASAPYIIAALAGGPAGGVALGAVGGAGTIKGDIYDTVKEELSARTNLSPAEIESRAQQAQAYNGENLDQILLGAGLGAVAGSTGLESGAAKLLSSTILKRVGEKEAETAAAQLAKKTAEKMAETGTKEGFIEVGGKGFRKRLIGGALEEAIPEAIQEGQEPLAQNIAMQRQGYDVPTMQGVGQAAILGGTLGAITGGPFEAAFGERPTRIAVKKEGETTTAENPQLPPPDGSAPAIEPTVNEPTGPAGPAAEPTVTETVEPGKEPTTVEPVEPKEPTVAKPNEPYLKGDPLEGPHTDLPIFSLPKTLAGAKPKFNLGKTGSYMPVFINDVDKALYIVAQPQKSSKDAEYRDFLKSVGFTDQMIDSTSKSVRTYVKDLAKMNYGEGSKTGAIPIDFMRMSPLYPKIIADAKIPEAPKPAVPKAEAPPAGPQAAPTKAPIIGPQVVQTPSVLNVTPDAKKELEARVPGVINLIQNIQDRLFPGATFSLQLAKQHPNSSSRTWGSITGGKEIRIYLDNIERDFKGAVPETILYNLFHEYSHATHFYWVNNADAQTQAAIFAQFAKDRSLDASRRYAFVKNMQTNGIKFKNLDDVLRAVGLTRPQYERLLKSEKANIDPTLNKPNFSNKYMRSFEEWIAEKGAQWLTNEIQGRLPKTAFENFQLKVLNGLRKIYTEIAKVLGLKPTEGAFEKMLADIWGNRIKVPHQTFVTQYTGKSGEQFSGATEEEATTNEAKGPKPKVAKVPPTTTVEPPTLREFADDITRPTDTGSWFGKALADITGQEKIVVNGKVMYEPVLRALLRNTVAANLPFLERPEFRQVGRLIERVQNMQGRIVGMIKYGALSYDPATQEFKFDTSVGGLKELFEKAGAARQAEIQALTVAMREYDLRKANRMGLSITNEKTGRPYTMGELKAIIDSADPVLKEVAANYRKFNDKMLKFALDTGIITKEQSEAFLSMMYTPFYRKQDETLSKDPNLVISPDIKDALNDPQKIKDFSPKLKTGSFLDPNFYENVFKNYSAIVTMGLKNVAYSSVAKAGLAAKDKTLIEAVGKAGENTITYRVDGDEKHIRVNDIPMFQALAALSPKQLQGWMKTFTRFTELLRLGVTSMPGFQLANVWRGLIDTHIKTGMPLFQLATDTFKLMGTGFTDTMKKGWLDNASYRAIVAQTGFGGYNIGSRAKDQANYLLRQYAKNEGTSTFKQRAQNVIDKLEEIGELSEMAPRIAYYNWLTKPKDKGGRGLSDADAAYEAMNLVNFSRSGTGRGAIGSFVAHMIPLVPFLNARIQGLYRLMESNTAGGEEAFGVKFDPNKGPYGIQKAIMMRGLMLLTFELALQGMFGDEDWYDKLSVQDKVANNYVKVGDTIIALPRPFELGSLFGAIPSLLIDSIRKDQPKEFMDGFMHILGTTFSFNAVPQAVKPLFDVYYANRDSFTGQEIETISEQKRPENERMDEYTSEVAKLIAKGVPYMSPKQADALLRGYLGTFSTVLTGTIDAVLSSGGTRPMGYFGDPTSFKGALANAAGLNRFLKDEKTLRNDYVSKFYDVKRTVEEITTSIKDAHDAKDVELVRQKLGDNPKAIALGKVLNRAESDINDINKQMRNIRNNPNLDSEKKTEYLNKLRDRKNIISERVYRIAKEVGYQ
jgi:hypothetical protein